MREVERRLHLPERPAPPADIDRLDTICRGTRYRPAAFAECHAIATDADSCSIATGGTLYPDHVVFLGPAARALDRDQTVAGVCRRGLPSFLLVRGVGTVLRIDLPSGAEPLLRCLGLVAARLPAGAEISYLSAEEERNLTDWDAERYRKAIARERPSQST
jgi:rhamnose utilization protein RhaD (predicted bifunctional aldolase and dehydrogenase)